jgi:hypothetical protein
MRGHSHTIRSRGVALLGLISIVALSSCLKSTEPQSSLLQLTGTWDYVGVQTGPVRENLTGTITISGASGTAFQGRMDLVGLNPQTGQSRLLGGLVSGSELGSNVIDFDASLETAPRRHVGQIVADTIQGTWVGSSPDGSMSSGTFRAERK